MGNSIKLLTFPNSDELALSIRAKALVFDDPRSQAILEHIDKIAPSEASVLIIGETGTGKELVARHVHERSRRKGPFVAINCGAFNETLVEAELFGHEAGAFTGAAQARAGWFEAANGGTLFLDEIGDIPLSLQVKLLRVLQERQVTRLGSRKSIALDIRLIAATNVELDRAISSGHFRSDLYYRLNVATVKLPPLRERPGDIIPLAYHFAEVYRRKLGLGSIALAQDAGARLLSYDWPGNIRELENVIHYATILCSNEIIHRDDLRLLHASRPDWLPAVSDDSSSLERLAGLLGEILEGDLEAVADEVERTLVLTAFDHCGRNQVRTAKRLGISRNILRAQLKRFGLLGDNEAIADEAASLIPEAII
ncbi:MAG TPA: sigma-54 dependent transcriptional regulator [Azonexus sp.]|nr:sigma-54 dependent transcriptional regulator [Azonexus sp.]